MRIVVAGAGPAGLYCAYRIKKRRPEIEIAIFEQNPRDATFGFGVVFSDRALEFLGADDPETLCRIWSCGMTSQWFIAAKALLSTVSDSLRSAA